MNPWDYLAAQRASHAANKISSFEYEEQGSSEEKKIDKEFEAEEEEES